jgi:hypothetical protein
VSFQLTAQDTCTGAQQVYTGSETVQNGNITPASISLAQANG